MADRKPMTIGEIRARMKPRRERHLVPLDGELVAEIDALERQPAAMVRAELAAVRAKAADTAVEFEFAAVPSSTWRKLIALHPDPRGRARWNVETFPPAMLAASCTDPVLTTVERSAFLELVGKVERGAELLEVMGPALELWNDWDPAVVQLLLGLAMTVNEGVLPVLPGVPEAPAKSTSRKGRTGGR